MKPALSPEVSPVVSFRVRFCLNRDSADHVDRWVRYAIQRGSNVVDRWPLTESDIGNILRFCPNVVDFVLCHCSLPCVLTIPSGRLVSLRVECCIAMEEIHILGGSLLVQFAFGGHVMKPVKFNFGNVEKLLNIIIHMNDQWLYNNVFQCLRQDFPAMRYLSIVRMARGPPPLARSFGQITAFQRLQVLRLYCYMRHDLSVLTVLDIGTACHILDTFGMLPPYAVHAENYGNNRIKPFPKYLRHVQIIGFCGDRGHVELARLLEMPLDLQQMVIKRKPQVWCVPRFEQDRLWLGEKKPHVVEEALLREMRSGALFFE